MAYVLFIYLDLSSMGFKSLRNRPGRLWHKATRSGVSRSVGSFVKINKGVVYNSKKNKACNTNTGHIALAIHVWAQPMRNSHRKSGHVNASEHASRQ